MKHIIISPSSTIYTPYNAAALIGVLVLLKHALSLLSIFVCNVLRPARNLTYYGKWAVVTGATDGLGKAIADELARKGLSVLLVSRTPAKLAAVQTELASKYPTVSFRTLAIDYSNFSQQARAQVAAAIGGLEVGVLINNVGVSYPFCQWFHELSDDEVAGLLALNVESTTWMTRICLPGMIARKRGAVVNLSSAAARLPMPLLAQYSACKGYIENLTRGLSQEYAGKGISVTAHAPLFVATAMTFPGSKVPVEKRASLTTPTAKTYARYAVAQIGWGVLSSPYWAHELMLWVQERVPGPLMNYLTMRMHLGVRFHKKNKTLMEAKKNS